MPPKTRITKELIIEKSFEITKSEGIENLMHAISLNN